MRLRIILAAVAVASLVSCAGESTERAERMVDVGTHALHATMAGGGAPTIVVDGGIGATSVEYAALQERLAALATTVTYDRAGYGGSEPGPLPRNAQTAASELRELLAELGVPKPYVLVGHSLGGLNAQAYAALYPDDVAGVVLLDPPPLSFALGEEYGELTEMANAMTEEWQAVADAGLGSTDSEERRTAVFFQALASEHREMFGSSAQFASSVESYGDLPLTVVASGVPNEMFGGVAAAYQTYWAGESEALAAKSERGRFVFVEESTHRLHEDAADVVVQETARLVDTSREAR